MPHSLPWLHPTFLTPAKEEELESASGEDFPGAQTKKLSDQQRLVVPREELIT